MKVLWSVVIVVLVLGAGAVVADRVLEHRTEQQIAEAIKANVDGVQGEPQVQIAGFPFLTQLAAGSLDHVTGTIDAANLSGVTAQDITFDGRDVSTSRPYTVGDATVAATLPTASIEQLVDQRTGLTVQLTSSGGAMRASGNVLGLPLTADLVPGVQGGQLVVDLQRVTVGGATISVADLPSAISKRLSDVTIPVTGLPKGLALSQAVVVDDGLRLTATGQDVALPTS